MTRSEVLLGLCVTVFVSCVAAVIVGAVFSSGQSRNVTTQALTLVDQHGHQIATLSSQHGSPEFVLLDQRHRKRAALFLESNGTPDLYLYDAAGKARLSLDLYDSGIGNLAFADGDGETSQPVAILESTKDGAIQIGFHDFRDVPSHGTSFVGGLKLKLDRGQPGILLVNASGKILWHRP